MEKEIIAVVILSLLAAVSGGPSDPTPRPDPNWLARHEEFVNNTIKSNGFIPIIFYGDSLTDFWRIEGKSVFDREYSRLNVTNYGISGDRTENVLWRIKNGEIQGLRPKLVVLMIGGNNLKTEPDVTEIIKGITTVVNTLKENLPTSKVLLLGLLPAVNSTAFEAMTFINSQLSNLDNGNSIRFFNMFDQFYTRWGVVNPLLYLNDLTHLTLAGYEKWAGLMHNIFTEMVTTIFP